MEKTTSSGSCSFHYVNPPREELNAATQKLNLHISFDEALKLNLAMQAALLELNKLKRSSTAGKLASINLVVDLNVENISIFPGKLSRKKKP